MLAQCVWLTKRRLIIFFLDVKWPNNCGYLWLDGSAAAGFLQIPFWISLSIGECLLGQIQEKRCGELHCYSVGNLEGMLDWFFGLKHKIQHCILVINYSLFPWFLFGSDYDKLDRGIFSVKGSCFFCFPLGFVLGPPFFWGPVLGLGCVWAVISYFEA